MADLKKFAIKIGLKKHSREGRGYEEVLDSIQDGWQELQDELGQFSDEDRGQLVQHFNELLENKQMGETLYGDLDDFKLALADLSNEEQKLLADELIRVEIFDPEN